MATLPGLIWRLTVACALTVVLTGPCRGTVWAQSAGSTGAAKSTTAAASGEHAADHAAAAHSASAAPASMVRLDSAASSAVAPRSDSPSAGSDSAGSGHYELQAALKSFDAKPRPGDTVFEHAAGLFPAFCKDWERKLHDRELNNLENVTWKDQNGWKTGTYLGYSPIKTCSCKRSTGGAPIGELTYQETEYYLTGRTVEEARHAQPKPVGVTNTTEIFRWDKTKWDDGQ
jgi:hypothetical protein